MQRRRLLQIGSGAAAILALAGTGAALWQPGLVDGRLSSDSRQIFSAVAQVVLDGALPLAAADRQQAIGAWLTRLERTVAGLPPHVTRELSDLLAVLATAAGRLALTGLSSHWPSATDSELASALQQMRTSSSSLRQQVYLALRELTNAAYFSEPATWGALGYPGPRAV